MSAAENQAISPGEILESIEREFADLSDNRMDSGALGNAIGIAVAKYLNKKGSPEDVLAFGFGVNHGINLIGEIEVNLDDE